MKGLMPHGNSQVPFLSPAFSGHEREIPAHLKLLNPPEAAEFLSVSKITLAGWRCSKRYSLPYIKIGRLVRYRQADLVAFLESHHVR
jgi:predicted DNA-binding transcriptional regulator AlpA